MKNLLLLFVFAVIAVGCSMEDGWTDPVIPVSLKGIEAINIDNSGEKPVVSNLPIKKEAYMVGIKWITDNVPIDEDDKFITDPIQKGEQRYSSVTDNYQKAIKCNTPFNSEIPAGKYISKFFNPHCSHPFIEVLKDQKYPS